MQPLQMRGHARDTRLQVRGGNVPTVAGGIGHVPPCRRLSLEDADPLPLLDTQLRGVFAREAVEGVVYLGGGGAGVGERSLKSVLRKNARG